jgi:hypothetical protein
VARRPGNRIRFACCGGKAGRRGTEVTPEFVIGKKFPWRVHPRNSSDSAQPLRQTAPHSPNASAPPQALNAKKEDNDQQRCLSRLNEEIRGQKAKLRTLRTKNSEKKSLGLILPPKKRNTTHHRNPCPPIKQQTFFSGLLFDFLVVLVSLSLLGLLLGFFFSLRLYCGLVLSFLFCFLAVCLGSCPFRSESA